MANNNQIYKMSNAGGFKSLNRYYDMLAGNSTWNPWEPQGAYDSLSTVTVPSGGVASVTFAGIPSTYKHLQIRYTAGATSGGEVNWTMTFNSDTTASYSRHGLYGNGAVAGALGGGNESSIIAGVTKFSTGIFNAGIIDILDYADTSKNKTVRNLSGVDWNGSGYIVLYSGYWGKTQAVTSVSFSLANFVENSQFTLYGVK